MPNLRSARPLKDATTGLVYKKGKFSATEEAQLSAAIERFKAVRGASDSVFSLLLFLYL